MHKSLKFRLLTAFLLINTLILFGFGLVLYNTAKEGLVANIDTELKIISFDVIADIKPDAYIKAENIARELEDEFQISPLVINIIYYDALTHKPHYTSLSDDQNKELFDIPLHQEGNLHDIYYYDKGDYRVSSMFIVEEAHTKIFFQLAIHKDKENPVLTKLLTVLLITSPLILLLILVITFILINRVLSPMNDVLTTVNDISAHKLSQRIKMDDIPLEIEKLVETFNALLDRLEDSFKRISTFSSDASHELKTPLTVIRGEIDIALRQERTPREYQEILKGVRDESTRVQETIDQLFFLAKKDSEEIHLDFEDLYLDEIVLESIEQLKPLASRKNINIVVDNLMPCTIQGNESLLHIVCANLIKNAVMYSHENSKININLTEDTQGCRLHIKDYGAGIKEEDLPFIFQRFYRADKARSRKNGGTGLGLSIVKMISDLHGYDIQVTSTIEEGSKFILSIKR